MTLGRHALVRFVPKVNITTVHGEPFSHPSNIPIFPMYHPAAALYNPNLRETLKEDIKKLKDFLDNGGNLQENIFETQSSFSKQAKEDINDILNM